MRLAQYLKESKEIGLCKIYIKTLSHRAQSAIRLWEEANWHFGTLEKAFKFKNNVAQEIIETFTPVRQYMLKKHGPTIKLLRGLRRKELSDQGSRVLSSWTSDIRVAEYFAGLKDWHEGKFYSMFYDIITNAEIDRLVAKYNETGYVEHNGYKFIRNKDHPGYYNIYNRDRKFVTDGDDLYRHFKEKQQENMELNQKIADNAIILRKNIKVNRIVWVTNRLECKEYIVANYDLV